MRILTFLPVLLAVAPVLAQSSAGFKLEEHVLNAGGHPADGTVLMSAGFRIRLDSIGEEIVRSGLSSASFRIDAGFAGSYPAPGEVLGLRFDDRVTLVWNSERSVGIYNLYRDLLSSLSGLGYGDCQQQDLDTATATDPDTPPLADGFFYLVTAENRLREEGTKGLDSNDGERSNPAPCP